MATFALVLSTLTGCMPPKPPSHAELERLRKNACQKEFGRRKFECGFNISVVFRGPEQRTLAPFCTVEDELGYAQPISPERLRITSFSGPAGFEVPKFPGQPVLNARPEPPSLNSNETQGRAGNLEYSVTVRNCEDIANTNGSFTLKFGVPGALDQLVSGTPRPRVLRETVVIAVPGAPVGGAPIQCEGHGCRL